MPFTQLLLIAFGVAADAFAAALCKGIGLQNPKWRDMLIVGLYFGAFQALMPLLGYGLGDAVKTFIDRYAPWVAFALLSFIGGKMLRESVWPAKSESKQTASLSAKVMVPLAVATSIDALAVGISFAVLRINIAGAVLLIGVVTLVTSALGVRLGFLFGLKFKRAAEAAGGLALIGIGAKILLEHLGAV